MKGTWPGSRSAAAAAAAVFGALLVLAGCSSTSGPGSATTTTMAAGTTTTSAADSSPTTTPGASAVNVTVTDQVRSELVAAAAALDAIPVSEYSGLRPGLTYYAYDQATRRYWAGAQLVPAPSSDPANPTQAQVASQDDGSYYVFTRSGDGAWSAHATGASGPDSPCPVVVPVVVTAVWGWTAGSCRPNDS